MNRPFIPTLVTLAVAALAFGSAAPAFAQAKLAGAWVLDAEKSPQGPKGFTIAVGKGTVTVAPAGGQALTFSLDGTPTPMPGGKNNTISAVKKGDGFVTTMKTDHGALEITWSREGDWMVQEGAMRGPGTPVMKLYFKKAPGAVPLPDRRPTV